MNKNLESYIIPRMRKCQDERCKKWEIDPEYVDVVAEDIMQQPNHINKNTHAFIKIRDKVITQLVLNKIRRKEVIK